MTTPNRNIPYVPENTLDPAAGTNDALDVIDAIIVPKVIQMDLTAPPGAPADGNLYVPASPATGDWEGLENYLVRYRSEGAFWQAYPPEDVYLLLNDDDGTLYKWDTTSSPAGWTPVTGLAVAVQNTDSPPLEVAPATRIIFGEGLELTELMPGVALVEVVDSGPAYAPVVTEGTTARVAAPADAGDYTRFTHADPKTYEFDGTEVWVVGTEFHMRNHGAGDLTLVGSNGFTINPPTDGGEVIPEGGTATLKIVADDEGDLFGVTVP